MLSRHLGFAHPDYMFKALTDRQYLDHVSVYLQSPFGDQIEMMQHAKIAAMLLNVQFKENPFETNDFLFNRSKKESQAIGDFVREIEVPEGISFEDAAKQFAANAAGMLGMTVQAQTVEFKN